MIAFDSSFASLSSKASRLFNYIEKIKAARASMGDSNTGNYKAIKEILSTLRCEGSAPSHHDIFFLLELFNNDVKSNNLVFLQQNLEFQLDKIHREMSYLNKINFKCDEVINDGAT